MLTRMGSGGRTGPSVETLGGCARAIAKLAVGRPRRAKVATSAGSLAPRLWGQARMTQAASGSIRRRQTRRGLANRCARRGSRLPRRVACAQEKAGSHGPFVRSRLLRPLATVSIRSAIRRSPVDGPIAGPESAAEPARAPMLAPTQRAPMLAPTQRAPMLASTQGAPMPAPTQRAPMLASTQGGPMLASTQRAPMLAPTQGAPMLAPAQGAPMLAPTQRAPMLASAQRAANLVPIR